MCLFFKMLLLRYIKILQLILMLWQKGVNMWQAILNVQIRAVLTNYCCIIINVIKW